MNINKVLKEYYYTHMPFVFYNDNLPNLLFTVQESGWWKLYYFDGKNISKINVGLDDVLKTTAYHQCQPTCYKTNDGIYHVSFCIQLNGKIYLYYSESTNILKLNPKFICSCCAGCVTPWYIIVGSMNKYIYILNKPKNFYNFLSNIDELNKFLSNSKNNEYLIKFNRLYIARCNYIPDVKDKLLISWASPADFTKYGSIYIDLYQKNGYDITTKNNEPLYKIAIDPLTEHIYYGKKIGESFEERQLVEDTTKNIKYKELSSKLLLFE